jgi:hypothetical protein
MTAKRVLLAFVVLIGLPYACSPVYRFPGPAPFSGTHFYNPYAGLRGQWKRTNLHAHGVAWGGLTNGEQPSRDVVRRYKQLGYDVSGVSNYHSIAAHHGVDTLPLYEHGYNVVKRHQLAIGATRVEWFDFPLWQWMSQQQFVISRVAAGAALVGLTHPTARGAYSNEALSRLTGYQLIEIVNGPFEAIEPWDAALSSGHAVWAMGNDDTHDTDDPKRSGMGWTMIDAPSTSTADIVGGLRAGRAYAVGRKDDVPAGMDVRIADVRFETDTLHVVTDGALPNIEFVGQGGHSRLTAERTQRASYTFGAHDTYVRAVVHTPQTTLYLNPVLRYDGRALPSPVATIDGPQTWLLRSGIVAALLATASLLWPRRKVLPAAAMSPALPETDQETA